MTADTDTAVRPSSRPGPAQTTHEDLLTWGPVHLDVTDHGRSLAFWQGLIGLQELGRSGDAVTLGVEDAALVVLHEGAARPAGRRHAGLYHLAIHLPSEGEFARVLARLFVRRARHAPTDHVMHWATYIDDPDGIGLELSFETLDRFGSYHLGTGRPMVLDSEGRLRDGVAPLDLDEVLAHLPDRDVERPLAPGSRIGHLHLHVGDIARSLEFYETVGFARNGELWGMGFADLSAGGRFPHRLAVNTWQGQGVGQPPPGTAGLRHAELHLRSDAALAAALARLAEAGYEVEAQTAGDADPIGGGLLVRDPSGNATLLSATPGGS
jgi:catechol 2,3-dioxygenase